MKVQCTDAWREMWWTQSKLRAPGIVKVQSSNFQVLHHCWSICIDILQRCLLSLGIPFPEPSFITQHLAPYMRL